MADSNRLHSINTSRILRTIWLNPGISRIKVAETLDLDRSTVTKIMQVIIDRGIVVTAGKNREQSGVGRRQINLEINSDLGVVLGLEIQDARYQGVLTGIDGRVLHSFEGIAKVDSDALADHAADLVERARDWAAGNRRFLLGVGLGLPGIVDPYAGTLIRSNSLKVCEPMAIRDEISARTGEYVFIENDANCCCWAELAFRKESRARNFIAVLGEFRDLLCGGTAPHGLAVGLGLTVRERVLHGDHFTAGEYRSVGATPETGQFRIPYTRFCELPDNRELLREVYRELTENLALLVNSVDFTKIVFTGDLPANRENLAEAMREAIAANWSYDLDRTFEIEFSPWGNQSVSMGAAGLFVEKLFSVPDIADRFQELVGYDLYEYILARKEG